MRGLSLLRRSHKPAATCEGWTPNFANWGIDSSERLLRKAAVRIAPAARRTLKWARHQGQAVGAQSCRGHAHKIPGARLKESFKATGEHALSFTKAGNEPQSCKAAARNFYFASYPDKELRPCAAVSRARGLVSRRKEGFGCRNPQHTKSLSCSWRGAAATSRRSNG